MDINETDLFTLCGEVIYGLLGSLGSRTHQDDDAFRVGGTVIIEEMILPAGELADLGHIFLRSFGDGIHLLVAGLAALEEDVGIHRGTAGSGMLRVQRVGAEGPQSIHVHQRPEILIVQCFDLLDLMRGTEAVEEVQERHTAVNSGQVCHGTQIHSLLGRGGCQQGEAGLTDAHDVAMVTEDTQRVNTECPGRDVEYAGEHFACDLIHIGNHQQQALRSCIGGGQGAGLQGAVDCTGSAALRLHLHDLYRLAEQILFTVGSPFVYMLCHRRGRRDGENTCNFRKGVRDICRRLVTVHNLNFFRHMKSPPFQSIHQVK